MEWVKRAQEDLQSSLAVSDELVIDYIYDLSGNKVMGEPWLKYKGGVPELLKMS